MHFSKMRSTCIKKFYSIFHACTSFISRVYALKTIFLIFMHVLGLLTEFMYIKNIFVSFMHVLHLEAVKMHKIINFKDQSCNHKKNIYFACFFFFIISERNFIINTI